MKCKWLFLGLLAAGVSLQGGDCSSKIADVKSGKLNEARAEWWAGSGGDMRSALQNALNSGAKRLIISRRSTPWLVSGQLNIPSNLEIVFEDGAEIRAMPGRFHDLNEALFMIRGGDNITMRGRGILTMNKKDYLDSSRYKKSEWRHTLAVFSGSNITVDGLVFRSSGGDGIYVNGVRNMTIDNVKCLDNNRQGISVISAENLLIRNSEFSGTYGAAPMAGIDFEPNRWNERLVNCIVENCRFAGNEGSGVELMLATLNEHTAPISVTVRNCVLEGNRKGFTLLNTKSPGVKGVVNIENCKVSGSKEHTFLSIGQSADGYAVHLSDCVFDNTDAAEKGALVLTGGYISGSLGNLHVKNLTVVDPRPDSRMFRFDDWKFHRLENLTGVMTHSSGSRYDLSSAVEQSKKSAPVKSAVINLKRIVPASGAVAEGQNVKPLRMRFSAKFLQYANAGDEVAVTVIPSAIGRSAVRVMFSLHTPSGKPAGNWEFTGDSPDRTIRFRAKESGIYQLTYNSPHGVQLVSKLPGNGVLAVSAATMNHTPGRMYFYVPAGVKEVALRVSGENADEWLNVDLLDPAGRVAASEKKVTKPTLLLAERNNPASGEVWSVRVNSAVDDYNIAVLGDSVPVLSATPDSVFRNR